MSNTTQAATAQASAHPVPDAPIHSDSEHVPHAELSTLDLRLKLEPEKFSGRDEDFTEWDDV